MVRYNIISSGSQGNAVILNGFVLVDCGVPYKQIAPYVPQLKLVLLTHIHGDHFCKRTLRRVAGRRATPHPAMFRRRGAPPGGPRGRGRRGRWL